MELSFCCPACRQPAQEDASRPGDPLRCEACGWSRVTVEADFDDDRLLRCLVCGCDDLWRRKDFPQRLGLLIVGAGILLSTIAWAYMRPFLAIGILMLFALADLLLYAVMSDVLVCYRCGARYRRAGPELKQTFRGFDHETAERHRQEARRLSERPQSRSGGGRTA